MIRIGSKAILAVFSASLAVSAAAPSLAGPALASRWLTTKMTQAACLERAESALKRTGFKTLESTEQSRYGIDNEFTAAVRCVAESGMIFFMATGANRERTDAMAGKVYRNFEPEKP